VWRNKFSRNSKFVGEKSTSKERDFGGKFEEKKGEGSLKSKETTNEVKDFEVVGLREKMNIRGVLVSMTNLGSIEVVQQWSNVV
jgi:hypothetical protein